MNSLSRFVIGTVVLICLLMAGISLLLSGCANHRATYTGLDKDNKPFTVELSANRFIMGQEVSGFSADFPGGYKVGFDASKSDPVKTMEAFFQVLGPILKDYMDRQKAVP